MFIFNNHTFSPITPDVLLKNNLPQTNKSNVYNNISSYQQGPSLFDNSKTESLFDYSPVVKSTVNANSGDDEVKVNSGSVNVNSTSVNNINNVSNVNNVNIEMPNIVLVSSPQNNPNLGFYTWIMQGSPSAAFDNADIQNQRKRKNSKLKKKKFAEESGNPTDY